MGDKKKHMLVGPDGLDKDGNPKPLVAKSNAIGHYNKPAPTNYNKAKAELNDMPIVNDEKNGAYVSGPLNMNAYQDKKASMDDYSHEKKLKADGRYEAAHGKTANAKNDFDHAHALKKDAHYDAKHRHAIMKHMKSN